MSEKINKLRSFMDFMRRVLALATPYFRSEDRWKARGLFAIIVALNLGSVYMLVLLNEWNRVFYDALQNKDAAVFWRELGRFCYLAFGFIVIAVYKFYLTQLLEVRWRAWMTGHIMDRWLAHRAFYRMELARFAPSTDGQVPDNPDQRIQEDLNLFTGYTIGLSMGLLNALVTLLSFVGILWSLSGAFSFSLNGDSFEIPGFMVWMAVVYCLLGSVASHYIGRPLIGLNFQQQRVEADFRHHLVRVREYSEAIALDRGERVERSQLGGHFGRVLSNYLSLIRAQKRLTWFTVGFNQAAVVFPFVVAAPRFFSGAIQLGELMQIASAFGRVQDALSWFVDNYSALAAWRATTDRLTSFESSLHTQEAHRDDGVAVQGSGAPELSARGLDLALPDGDSLLAGTDLRLSPGDTVMLQGPSGSGKSTLFRALAGIWPHAQGEVRVPEGTMFIPQRPYFPLGSLRAALAYPEAPERYADAELQQALRDALLPELATHLDEEANWGMKLSGGEQQRLAMARVLLKKAPWVLADEATSALDEATEQRLYERLVAQTRELGGALLSIAHKPTLQRFHKRVWTLRTAPATGPARWRLDDGTEQASL